jgi:hypothetical protein
LSSHRCNRTYGPSPSFAIFPTLLSAPTAVVRLLVQKDGRLSVWFPLDNEVPASSSSTFVLHTTTLESSPLYPVLYLTLPVHLLGCLFYLSLWTTYNLSTFSKETLPHGTVIIISCLEAPGGWLSNNDLTFTFTTFHIPLRHCSDSPQDAVHTSFSHPTTKLESPLRAAELK